MTTIFLMLFFFQIKHLVCDYFLQGKYMLGKFLPDYRFVLPLMAHCGVHFVGTFFILICFGLGIKFVLILSAFDFVTHFFIDRVKASPKMLGVFKTDQREFWLCLGADQFGHHIIHYTIILVAVSKIL